MAGALAEGYAFLIKGFRGLREDSEEEERGLESWAGVVKALGTCWLVAAALGLGWQRAGLAWFPGQEVASSPAVHRSIVLHLSLVLRFSKAPRCEGNDREAGAKPACAWRHPSHRAEPPGCQPGARLGR